MFPDSINIFAAIASKCLQKNRDDRPTMLEVVEEIEKALKSQVKGVESLRTSLEMIRLATNDFSNISEHDGCGKVYKGEFSHSKGHNLVTVKRLDSRVDLYENEFYKVIGTLYSYSHKNVIPLLGFCDEGSERIVVFEHMVNGSLNEHVKNISLTWNKRLKICTDAARGLAYIHSSSDTRYSIHGDIKSSSIELNHDWKAVISNFIISNRIGTLGYYNPLYANTGIPTQKSDVYSFGVVLFEILCGRMAIETLKMDHQQPLPGSADGDCISMFARTA